MTLSNHKGKQIYSTLFKIVSCKISEQCLFLMTFDTGMVCVGVGDDDSQT
jgi:hypothetical protein